MISTRGRYALRVMLDLAQNLEKKNSSVKDIAARQQISAKYLESVIAILNKAGLVVSKMGKNGGYHLAKKPEEYCIGDILRLTEGRLVPVNCLQCCDNPCERAKDCITLPMWRELGKIVNHYLDHLTLKDLLEGNVAVSPIDKVGDR